MKERNQSIDAIRFVAAILVVCLHAGLPKGLTWSSTILFVARTGVPIFFMISGYMFGARQKSDPHMDQYTRRQLRKIAKIAFAAFAFYILIDVWRSGHRIVIHVLTAPKSILKFFFLNNVYYGGHLWYLFAYLAVLTVYLILLKTNKVKWMYYWTPVGLILYEILGKYSKLVFGREMYYLYARNFLMIGIPCFAVGYWLGQKEIRAALKRKNLEKAGWIILMALEVWMLWGERLFLVARKAYVGNNNFIANTFLGATALVFALRFPGKKRWVAKVADWGRKYSMQLYIFHPFFKRCFDYVAKKLPFLANLLEDELWLQIWRGVLPVLCVIGCIAMKIAWDLMMRQIKDRTKKREKTF